MTARQVRAAVLVVGLALLCAGCAGSRPAASAAAARTGGAPAEERTAVLPAPDLPPKRLGTPTATAERRIGAVRLVGPNHRFILIENPAWAGRPLPDGLQLRCRSSVERGGTQTALVRISRERREQFVVADVLSGQPSIGDDVFLPTDNGEPPAPPAPAGAAPRLDDPDGAASGVSLIPGLR